MRVTVAAATILAGLALAGALPAAAEITTDTVRQRQEAACYDDATKLCNDAIPDEKKVEACMRVHRKQLSVGCRKIFDSSVK